MLIFLHFQFLIIQMTKEVNRILLIDLNTHFYHFYNFKSLYFLYFFIHFRISADKHSFNQTKKLDFILLFAKFP